MWGEDNDFNVQAMITRLMWTIWTSPSAVRERPLNLITHSLTVPKFEYISVQQRSILNKTPALKIIVEEW